MRTKAALTEYAPLGSDIYYILRQVPSNKKQAYLAVHGFTHELYKISEHYREVKIAQQKLAWWAEEIKRLSQGVPTHPLGQELSLYIKIYDLKEIELLALIEGSMLSTSTQIFETRSELRQHYQHTGGIPAILKAKILSHDLINLDTHLQKAIHQLGIAQEILRHLLEFPKFLQRQHLYLPIDLFQQQQIDPGPILQGKDLNKLVPLLQTELTQAETILSETLASLNKQQIQSLRPLILEIKLKLKTLKKIANRSWQIFDYRLELSPIVKLLFTEFAS